MSSSGIFSFDPAFSSVVLAAYARIGVRRAAITTEHLIDAGNEGNYLLSRISNLQPLLWTSEVVNVPLVQGTATYTLDKQIVILLDVNVSIPSGGGGVQSRVLGPLSTVEYDALPNKTNQAPPNSYWLFRGITPQITFWPVPDDGGPYTANLRAVTQPQDAVMPSGVTLDLPYRAQDAFVAGLAHRLARIHAPDLEDKRKADADEAWNIFAGNDLENVNFFLIPGIGGYYR